MAQKLALIIGNSDYQDPALAQLQAPDADVRALTDLLRQPDIGQFDDVIPLVNESEAKTRRAIASFFARAKPDDLLLLYFSGHGVLDDKGRLYLAANDTQRDLPQATAISAAFVTDAMDSSRSRRQVLILDCCHSGAFARGARSAVENKAVTAATFEGVGYGRAVITATDATQFAWEGETVVGTAENSVFTHCMIEGLKTGAADVDEDGQVTLEELYNYLYGEVVKRTPKQTPRKWSYNQEGEFVIARNPRPIVVKPLPLPDDLQHSLEDLRPWVRTGALGELERLLFGEAPGLALSAHAALVKLKDDDSRRVSMAAAELAAKYEAVQLAREQERLAAEQAARERAEAERLAAERAAAERAAREKAAREKAEAERLAAERAAAERVAREKAEAERLAAEQAERERVEAERLAAEKAARDKAEAERLAAERAAAEQAARDKAEAERLAAERAAAEIAAREKAEREKAEAERLAAEKAAAEQAERERIEAERLAVEKAAAEKAAREKAEAQRLAAEREAQQRAGAERLAAEQAAQEKAAAEKAEAERLAAERAAAEQAAREKAAAERLAAEKAEAPLPGSVEGAIVGGDVATTGSVHHTTVVTAVPAPAMPAAGPPIVSPAPSAPPSRMAALPSLARSILQQVPAPVQAVALIGLGWALAGGLGRLLVPPDSLRDAVVNGVLVGAACGAVIGFALRRLEPAWTSKHVWQVTGGTAGTFAISLALIAGLLTIVYDQELWDLELPALVLGAAVGGALGGYVLGTVWRSLRPAWGKGRVWRMVVAWASSLAAAAWLVGSQQSVQGNVLFGALAGTLGGVLSLWIAGPAPTESGGASQQDAAMKAAPTESGRASQQDAAMKAAPAGSGGPAGQPVPAAAAGERPAPQLGSARTPAAAVAPAGLQALIRAPWFAVILIGVGWALARWLAEFAFGNVEGYFNLGWFLNWSVGGVLGGALTGLALRQLGPERGGRPVWVAAGSAAAAWVLGWLITYLVWHFVWGLELSIPEPLPSQLGLPLGSAIGGYALGGAWRGSARQRWLLAGGWAASWLVGNGMAWQLHSQRDWPWGWRWGGLAGGLLLGLATVWAWRAAGAGDVPLAAPAAAEPPRVARGRLWLAVGLVALGWGAARGLGYALYMLLTNTVLTAEKLSNLADMTDWVFAGALGGWLTALALRRAVPAFGRGRAGRLAGLWAGAWAVAYMVAVALGEFGGELGLDQYWKFPSNAGLFVGGAIGGLALAAAWHAAVAAVTRRQAIIIAAGWGLGWLLADLLRWAIIEASSWSTAGWIAGWALGGLLAGLIGAGVMLWVLTERSGEA